jgi:lysozyme family protein
MTRFEKFIEIIFKNEGGLSNLANDKGGLTKYGISKTAYPNLDIKNLTNEQAKNIYHTDYYNRLKIDQIQNELLALHVFDFGVNAGLMRSTITLQNVAMVKADGLIGEKTLLEVNSKDYSQAFIKARIDYYNKIAVGKNAGFLHGWINRVNNTSASL